MHKRQENKLEQQSENFKQDTIKITKIEELKIGNLEIKQSIIDGTAQSTEKIVDTNLRIDTITENVCGIIDKQTELICEEFILVENTFVITNDKYKKVINIKEEKQIKFNKTYPINSDIPTVRHTHTQVSHIR